MAALEGLEDEERARDLFEQVLQLDPDHADAAQALSEIYFARGDHERLAPVLDVLLRKANRSDMQLMVGLYHKSGAVAAALEQHDRAARQFRRALELDSNHLPSLRGLAAVAFEAGDWGAARDCYMRVVRRADALEPRERVLALHRLGTSHRQLGNVPAAVEVFQGLLELDPGHRDALQALAELQSSSSDWEAVLRTKYALAATASPEERVALFREIGDIHWQRLGQPERAEQAYREALQHRPDDHGCLHQLIELYTAIERWEGAVEACGRMAELEPESSIQAKYLFTIAVIYRDQLGDPDEAIRYFNRTLDADPTHLKAFEAIDQLCTRLRAWKKLEQSYGRMLKRLPEEGQLELKVMLWHNLGEILRSRRRDFEGAIAAFEAAHKLRPDDRDRRRILLELYLASGPAYLDRAAALEHAALREEPRRVSPYRTLRRIYMDGGRYDRAWVFCQILSFIGEADPEESGFFAQYRRARIPRARGSLTDEMWARHLLHEQQPPLVNALFGVITPAVASMTVRPADKYGLRAAERRDPADQHNPLALLFDCVTATFAVTSADLYMCPGKPGRLMMAHTPERPSFVAGAALMQSHSELEMAFVLGKQLTYLRAEHFLRNALPTRGQLQAALLAALKACRPDLPVPEAHARAVKQIIDRLRRHLGPDRLEQLARIVSRFRSAEQVDLDRWWNAIDLTSDRAGLLMCNDLEVAARVINAEPGSGDLPASERVTQLLRFASSESYFVLRERLGLTIEG